MKYIHNSGSRLYFITLLLLLMSPASSLFAQFSPAVEKFIYVKNDTLALIHAKITDGTGAPSDTDQTLVIIKGIITAKGHSANTLVPAHAKTIDCSGKTIIPE